MAKFAGWLGESISIMDPWDERYIYPHEWLILLEEM